MRYLDSPLAFPLVFGEKEQKSLKIRKLAAFRPGPGVMAGVLCFCLLLGFFLGLLRARSRSEGVTAAVRAPAEETVRRSAGLVDINAADEAELQTLPGIGPALAERIVAYREAHGRFQYLYELTNVKGIGIATFEALQELITLGAEE